MAITNADCYMVGFQNAIRPSLKKGIQSVRCLANLIFSVDPNDMTHEYNNIRRAIEEAKLHLGSAENAAKAELKEVDRRQEQLVVEKTRLHVARDAKILEHTNVMTQLTSNRETLCTNKQQLREAFNHMESCDEKLRSLHQKQWEATRNMAIGVSLLVIPVVGPIAGGLVMTVSAVDLVSATDAANSARAACIIANERVSDNERRVRENERKLEKNEEEIIGVDAAIEKLDNHIEESRRRFTLVTDVQEKFRNACHSLGGFDGSVAVMEVQTRSIILLESLVDILGDIAQKTSEISENEGCQRLLENDVEPLVIYLKENLPKLKAICEKDDCGY